MIDQNIQTSLSLAKQKMSQFSQKSSPSFHRFLSHPVFYTYLDLLSLERTIAASELTKIKKCDRNLKTGWLHDEIINSFFYQLTNRNEELLYCDSTAVRKGVEVGLEIMRLKFNV